MSSSASKPAAADSSNLSALNAHFRNFSYINEYMLTSDDFKKHETLKSTVKELNEYCYLRRWYDHIASQSDYRDESSKSKNELSGSSASTCRNYELHEASLPQILLNYLFEKEQFDTNDFALSTGIDHQKVVGSVQSLLTHEDLITTVDRVSKKITLTAEGIEMMENGSHEANVFHLAGDEGIKQDELMRNYAHAKIGISKAMANGWIAIDKSSNSVRIVRKVDRIEDTVCDNLKRLANGLEKEIDAKILQDFKKRKLALEQTMKTFLVRKGSSFTTSVDKQEVDITAEMIMSGSWKTKAFKPYNFNALGLPQNCGHLHPLMKVRHELRQIFFQMGFSEMPTNRYVESSFWNFDALFQPQNHPARDAQDTFFLSDPATSDNFPSEYMERVKQIHSNGGYGSIGYNYDWKIDEARKNVLRTHTTAISARQLFLIAQQGFKPAKLFSIDRVFRNETLDATHLAEFHQVEGVIADRDLSLAHVMGLFTEFFRKCGIANLRFKPTYNPYTEPSMEIYAFHDGLDKWIEIGNSGMFRPEMLLPMGFPDDVNVAGYGLSLERPTMIRYGINNIRDLFGPKINLQMVYRNPICRLDKI